MVTVSIIVPVYNAENTLKRCVDSILNQEYSDFELILINDGSKDLSGSICDEYARKDPRVRVIHKENTGVSDTRNMGIEAAEGEYLQFVDADDWITADATKLMVREASERNCELVITDFYRVVGKRASHKGSIKEEGEMTREELAEHMKDSPADFYYGVLWNKLFRKDIIRKHQIRMDENVSWCEDFLFNLEYILIDSAGDGVVIPVFFSNAKKLGEERVPIVDYAVGGRGYLTDHYRNVKLLERYYQAIGLRYELTLNDIKVLAHASQINVVKNRKELADYAGIAPSAINHILQKLTRRKMIEEVRHKEYLEIQILEEGQPVLRELKNAFSDYDRVRFQGFTEDEIEEYLHLQNRIAENLSRVLKNVDVDAVSVKKKEG